MRSGGRPIDRQGAARAGRRHAPPEEARPVVIAPLRIRATDAVDDRLDDGWARLVLLVSAERAHTLDGDAVFTWLYRIGVNESLGRLRRKRLVTVDLESPAAAGVHDSRVDVQPTLSAESSDIRSRVHAALATLPFEYREAVVLRDLAGLSNEEVADALGVTLAAAKSRIHRGRMSLREPLEPELGG